MNTFVVWLGFDGKWHYHSISGYFPADKFHDETASQVVKSGVGYSAEEPARASFAVHAWTPSQAIRTAKEYYRRRQLR